MTRSLALAFAIFAIMFCLAVQPASAQGTSSASAPGSLPDTIEKSPATILNNNPQLGTKLQLLLPDTTPEDAAKGYKSIGDFVTAVHASHDVAVPFSQLKCAELGGKFCSPETSAKPTKIENAILALKPDLGKDGAKKAANDAKHEGSTDLKGINLF
jgi:hypothetical protein